MDLQHVPGRVIISIDLEKKNWHTFSNGQKIRRERQFNNLNRRETEPVNATVISGEGLQEGSEILIHPNVVHDSNRIFNYKPLSGEDAGSDIKYYSALDTQCFAWLDGSDWKPLQGFDFGLRVFKPYSGLMVGIEPTLVKNVLYVTTGEFKGWVVHTVPNADYQIVFQGINGQEGNIIRFRHFPDEDHEREEVVAISYELTEKVNSGEYVVGVSIPDAKPLKELV